jgi:diguanylate cyclase (GGDEF)-like protein
MESRPIATKPYPLPDPVEIARAALRNLTGSGLPPTPENFAREYRSVAGLPPAAAPAPVAADPNAETMRELERIVAQVSVTSADLASGVDRFEIDTGPLLAGMGSTATSEILAPLLQAFTRSTTVLRRTVDASREELGEIRRQLDHANEELRRAKDLANTDPLTGLANRRALNDVLARDIALAHRIGAPFSIAILDVDHFKQVNDQHGHTAGDQALMHLAVVAKGGVRDSDAILRYGGEEFIILLPGAGAEGAYFVVDRLRMMVEKTPFMFGHKKITLRFSAGVAQLGDGEGATGLLERADRALYQAKEMGRNRVHRAIAMSVAP